MVEHQSGVLSAATILERTMQRALAAQLSAMPSTAPVSPASMTRVLSWNGMSLDGEGPLPAAIVTWSGHGTAGATASIVGVEPASTAVERGTDAAAAVAIVTADENGATPNMTSLGALPVGGGLVDVLAGVSVADVGDAELLDVAARWQEVVSWATAMQSRALGEIGRRRGWTQEHNAAAAEISARLRVPQDEANKHLARGAGLAEHPPVLDALQQGLIDTAKADILLRSGNPLTTEERAQAITLYLPEAPERTRRWLRDKMNEFANGLKGSVETVKHARSRRAVFLDPADNAMAWLSANLPATDAAAVWDAIEQAAHTLRRTPGGTRTLAQARADALVAITTGRLIVPPQPECAPTGEDTSAGENSTATGNTGMAAGDSIIVDPGDGNAAPGTAAGGPAAAGTLVVENDRRVHEPALPRTTVPATGCTCGGCTCGGTAVRVVPVRPQIRVTIAATTLLGLDNHPGHLDGYGPIPADLAARIATDATWQRLLTDPTTGILTDYSTTTYQPGKVLRHAVIARDQTCGFLQCDRSAHWADLDHIHPFDHELDPTTQPPGTPGQTRATNLQPLCRAHHLAKTHHGWTPVRDPDTGITTWTAPTGHTYTRPPTTVGQVSNDTTSLTNDTRARLGQPPLNETPTTTGRAATQPSTEQPSAEQRPRRFPDQPPF